MLDKEQYVKAGGVVCPFCGCDSLEGGFVQVDAGKAYQAVRCGDCHNRWQDIYELVDIMLIRGDGVERRPPA